MKVWVLTVAEPYEGEALLGVYASKEDAEAAKSARHKHKSSDGILCTYEVEVGAAPRWYLYDDRLENRD